MKRTEIETALTWDLSALFQSDEAFEEQVQLAKEHLASLIHQKGKIAQSKETFVNFMNELEVLHRYMDNIEVYAIMLTDVDPENTIAQQQLSKASSMVHQVTTGLSFLDSELIKDKDQIERYLQEDDCASFRYFISEILRTIPHRLDEATEELMANVEQLAKAPEDTFQCFRLVHEPVMVDGEEQFLNGATYHEFLLHRDESVRKEAFEHYLQEYKRYSNVFMNTLTSHAKGQVLKAKTRHYQSALASSLFEDGAEEALFRKVLFMANEKYHPFVEEYFQLRKDILQLDTQHVYDINLELVEDFDIHYSIDECFDIMDQALSVLGEDYVQLLHQAKEERWIDFLPCEGKRSGAYSWGTYDSKPYILLNFNGSYDSLSTLAHELGHSMHSYYSHQNNRALNAGYRIFVAEVASTVNEILLNTYLLKTSTDKKYRAYILSNLLTQMVGTIYRQPMYAQFEADIHEWIEQQEAVSSDRITSRWKELNEQYYGKSVFFDELERYRCYSIPHFYYNFYVYKYTLGMSVALSFVKRILNGDVEDYRTFLTKGGSESPIDELIHAGVDPCDDRVYDDAFTYFKEILDEFKDCMN